MTLAAPESAQHGLSAARVESAREPVAHRFWLRSRAALPLDAFRIIVGVLLALHFVRAANESVPLLRAGFLEQAFATSPLQGHATRVLPVVLVGRALLALAIAAGIAPRFCAALLLIVGAMLSAPLSPLSHLDDWTANLTCFWLMLLPVGRSLRLVGMWRRRATDPAGQRVSGVAVALFLVHVLTFYLHIPLWSRLSPLWTPTPWLLFAASAVPGLYLLPAITARRLAALLQTALHGYLLLTSGEPLTHGLLMATTVLFWGEPQLPPSADMDPIRFDAGGVIAAGYSVLLAAWLLSSGARAAELNQVTSHVLHDLGLHVPAPAHLAELKVHFVGSDGRQRDWQDVPGLPPVESLATRLLLTRIVTSALSPAADQGTLAHTELSNLARLYCLNRVPSERRNVITIAAPELQSKPARPIATFHCYAPQRSLQLLSATSAAPHPARGSRLPHVQ